MGGNMSAPINPVGVASNHYPSAPVVTPIYNVSTNTFTCPASNPNGDFCAGDSLVTNIIIRCTNGVGQPGNCNDNLAGKPPLGVNYSPCYQSSPTSGDAACSKNCIVYGSSGNYNSTFTLPNCTVTSSSASVPTSSTSATETSTSTASSVSSAIVPPGSSAAASGGTLATSAASFATATPVSPTSAPIVVTTSGARLNSASVMAAIGLIVAYFL